MDTLRSQQIRTTRNCDLTRVHLEANLQGAPLMRRSAAGEMRVPALKTGVSSTSTLPCIGNAFGSVDGANTTCSRSCTCCAAFLCWNTTHFIGGMPGGASTFHKYSLFARCLGSTAWATSGCTWMISDDMTRRSCSGKRSAQISSSWPRRRAFCCKYMRSMFGRFGAVAL